MGSNFIIIGGALEKLGTNFLHALKLVYFGTNNVSFALRIR